jgi:hypothetical protein
LTAPALNLIICQVPDYETRRMHRDQLDTAVEWAAAEGWNPGLYDADAFFATDPTGFFVGLLDSQPAASISVVKYSEAFAFVGFYIVRPDLRGQGPVAPVTRSGPSSRTARLSPSGSTPRLREG